MSAAVFAMNPLGFNGARNLIGLEVWVAHGPSMEPTYTGRFLGVGLPGWFGRPGRGDLVSFDAPDGSGDRYLKRVVGLPGETIAATSKGILVDGRLLEEPYIRAGRERHPGSWKLAEDEYFVAGDNRPESFDSRAFGPVPGSKLKRVGVASPLTHAHAWATAVVAALVLTLASLSIGFALACARYGSTVRNRTAYAVGGLLLWLPFFLWARGAPARRALAEIGPVHGPPDMVPMIGCGLPLFLGFVVVVICSLLNLPLVGDDRWLVGTVVALAAVALIPQVVEQRRCTTVRMELGGRCLPWVMAYSAGLALADDVRVAVLVACATVALPLAMTPLFPDLAAARQVQRQRSPMRQMANWFLAHLFWLGVVVAMIPASPCVHAAFLACSLAILLDGAAQDDELFPFLRLVVPTVGLALGLAVLIGPAAGEPTVSALMGLLVAALGVAQIRRWGLPSRPASAA